MGAQELRKEFQSILRDGFDDDFIEWCVNEFDSHEITDNQLPSARLYLVFLRQTMEFLSCEEPEVRCKVEQLCAALQNEGECTIDNVLSQAERLEKESSLCEDIAARALALGVAIYALGIKKAGFNAGSYMKMFVIVWLTKVPENSYFLKNLSAKSST